MGSIRGGPPSPLKQTVRHPLDPPLPLTSYGPFTITSGGCDDPSLLRKPGCGAIQSGEGLKWNALGPSTHGTVMRPSCTGWWTSLSASRIGYGHTGW